MKVYMDNNATTCVTQEVVDAMLPYFTQNFGNASSKFYEVGQNAEAALLDMRKRVAACIGASKENEIYFKYFLLVCKFIFGRNIQALQFLFQQVH